MYIGALEAGGTKMVVAITNENGVIYDTKRIPTTMPEETFAEIIGYFKECEKRVGKLDAIGVASFGPIGVDKNKANYGKILDTPKEGWAGFDILGCLKETFDIPIGIHTDVTGSALGEINFGSSKGIGSVAYITVGTGIGVGLVIDGKPVSGMLHPEAGHMLISPVDGDENNCVCPFHKNCLEGLASGPSIMKRYGISADKLTDNDKVWELEAEYLSTAIANLVLTVSPERVILGGGVMHQLKLFSIIRKKVLEKLNGYLKTPELSDIDSYIVPASLPDTQGILGCVVIAKAAI